MSPTHAITKLFAPKWTKVITARVNWGTKGIAAKKKRFVILTPVKMVRRVLIEMIENMNVLVLWDSKENYVRC